MTVLPGLGSSRLSTGVRFSVRLPRLRSLATRQRSIWSGVGGLADSAHPGSVRRGSGFLYSCPGRVPLDCRYTDVSGRWPVCPRHPELVNPRPTLQNVSSQSPMRALGSTCQVLLPRYLPQNMYGELPMTHTALQQPLWPSGRPRLIRLMACGPQPPGAGSDASSVPQNGHDASCASATRREKKYKEGHACCHGPHTSPPPASVTHHGNKRSTIGRPRAMLCAPPAPPAPSLALTLLRSASSSDPRCRSSA